MRGSWRIGNGGRAHRMARSRMKPTFSYIPFPLLALAVLLALGPCPARAEAADPDLLLSRVRQTWELRKNLRARIAQEQRFAGFDEPVLSTGTLKILRPRYFDLLFDPPHRQRQICDGTFVWTYMEDQKQAFKSPLGNDATRGADLLQWAMSGAAVREAIPDSSFRKGALKLVLTPGPNLPLQELILWVNEGSAEILGCQVTDTEGNRTLVKLLDVSPAPSLRPRDFQFTPPKGTEVIDLENQG